MGTLDQVARYLTTGTFRRFDDLERPVVNKTGLTGEYDFTLEWTPDTAPEGSDSDPALFTAVQEQLGPRLEAQKGPVGVTAIDHIEMPSEN